MDKLWLDIVIAVDTSTTMGSIGLANVVNLLIKLFASVNVGQGMRHQTRIGIVSYASTAQVVANWSMYESFDQFKDGLSSVRLTRDDSVVGLLEAFTTVEQVVHGRKLSTYSDINGNGQTNRRIMSILVASAYSQGQEDPMPLVKQLKAGGQRILTIAALPKNDTLSEAQRIGSMASEGMKFTINRDASHIPDTIVENMKRSLCEANCFCLNDWLQLSDSFRNPQKRFAECLLLASTPANWLGASYTCAQLGVGRAGFLTSELSRLKHDFNVEYVRYATKHTILEPYYIGLSYEKTSGRYFWDERDDTSINKELNSTGFQPWHGGPGNRRQSGDAVRVAQLGTNTYWFHEEVVGVARRFICQLDACDTDNYCDDT